MTLIELFTVLVKRSTLTDEQKADAYVLIQNLKRINAFSNTAMESSGEHKCINRYVEREYKNYLNRWLPGFYMCTICGRKTEMKY